MRRPTLSSFKTTRIKMIDGIGQIMQTKRRRITIDLKPLYKMLGERSEADIDRALVEFFAKAVVGQITKSNQWFLDKKPNRQKIFMGAIRHLHDLFMLTRKFDVQTAQIRVEETQMRQAAEALNNQVDGLYVGGGIIPELELQFTLPEVECPPEGGFAITVSSPGLLMSRDPESQSIVISRSGIDGNGEEETLETPLQNTVLRMHEGLPVWEPIVQQNLVPAD